jgi:murein DD-endopeptidase MepM/ murein hydrolase activator NlpD
MTTLRTGVTAAVLMLMSCCGMCCGLGGVITLTAQLDPCTPASSGDSTVAAWDDEQVANATTIVTVGARMQVQHYGWVVAVATAMQESSLRNLPDLGAGNDHDSLGLFQQRPSQGWGTPDQLQDPTYAATAFYTRLVTVPGWAGLQVTDAAQAVQRSATPTAYAQWEQPARALVARIRATLGLGSGCTGWVAPLDAGSYQLSSPFGPRDGVLHAGVDLAAATGTPIHAAAAGTVTAAGCTSPFCDRPGQVDADGRPATPGCGWAVTITHAGGVASRYCHATRLAVHTGQTVAAGQVIGWVGATGNATGPHLHFEIHTPAPPVDDTTAVDPVAFLRHHGVAM